MDKRGSLWKLAVWKEWWQTFLQFLVFILRRFVRDGCVPSSASLTYTTLFAVVPLMTVTYAMLAAIPSLQGVGDEIQQLLFKHFVPSTGNTLQTYLEGFSQQARQLTSYGVGFLVVTAYMMLKTVEKAFNGIWHVSEPRKGMASFLLYWAILSLGPLLLGMGFVVTSYLASLSFVQDTTETLGIKQHLLSMLPMLLSATAFTLIYAAVPNVKVPLKHAFIGGVTVAILFETAKSAFTLYVTHFPNYQLVYGAFAAVPLFLLWIYLSWMIVLLGGELVRGLSVFRAERLSARRLDLLLVLRVINWFWARYQKGDEVKQDDWTKLEFPIGQEQWLEVIQLLQDNKFVQKTSKGFVLARDLHTVSLWELNLLLDKPLPADVQLPEEVDGLSWYPELRKKLVTIETLSVEQLNFPVSRLFLDKG